MEVNMRMLGAGSADNSLYDIRHHVVPDEDTVTGCK